MDNSQHFIPSLAKKDEEILTSAQISRLDEEFCRNRNKKINTKQLSTLAKELNLNEAQIKKWFSNGRRREKRHSLNKGTVFSTNNQTLYKENRHSKTLI